MTETAQALAEQFERANAEVIACVARLSDAEWKVRCEEGGRRVGVVAYHVAAGHLYVWEFASIRTAVGAGA